MLLLAFENCGLGSTQDFVKRSASFKVIFSKAMTFLSSETWRKTSIRSLASILFIKPELPCRALHAPGVILK